MCRVGEAMATNITVVLKDEPGQLAKLGEATGRAGINLLGMCALTGEGRGVINILVEDAGAARDALQDAGMGIADSQEALVVDAEDRPGTLGQLARELADAGVNIELLYSTFSGVRVAIVTDDLASARAALR
jgi:hypothetical protein